MRSTSLRVRFRSPRSRPPTYERCRWLLGRCSSPPGPKHPSTTERAGRERFVVAARADMEELGAWAQLAASSVHPQHPTLGEGDSPPAASTATHLPDFSQVAHGSNRYLQPVTPEPG